MEHIKIILLVTSFILPFALAIALFINARHSLPKRVMAFALLNTTLVFLFNYFYFQKEFSIYSAIYSLHIGTVLWIFPSIYLYIKSIVLDKTKFKQELFHLLPGTVFAIVFAILLYGFLNYAERIYYLTTYRSGVGFTSLNLKVLFILRFVDVGFIVAQVIYYSIVIVRMPNCYLEQLQNEFSNADKYSINWIRGFQLSFVVIGLLCIFFYVFNPFKESNDLLLVSTFFLVSLFVWAMGIVALKHKQAPEGVTELPLEVIDNNEETLQPRVDLLMKQLIEYLEREQAFLQPDLSLTAVCKELSTNRTYLSSVINQQLAVNFCSLINQYRIRYINDYLNSHPHTTNEELAQIGGFGSISSMKRAMKREKGMTQ